MEEDLSGPGDWHARCGDHPVSRKSSPPLRSTLAPALAEAARGFTLLEVLIAMSVFCIAVFAILDLTSRCLRSARSLQTSFVNVNSLAAELSLTNRLYEGPIPPELI